MSHRFNAKNFKLVGYRTQWIKHRGFYPPISVILQKIKKRGKSGLAVQQRTVAKSSGVKKGMVEEPKRAIHTVTVHEHEHMNWRQKNVKNTQLSDRPNMQKLSNTPRAKLVDEKQLDMCQKRSSSAPSFFHLSSSAQRWPATILSLLFLVLSSYFPHPPEMNQVMTSFYLKNLEREQHWVKQKH